MEQLTKIKTVCSRIFVNTRDVESIKELQQMITASRPTIIQTLEPIIFSVFFPVLKEISESNTNFKEKEKQQIVETFKALFEKITIDKLPLFFNIYGFLLFEIYDHKNNSVLDISEEYKLSIVECMTALSKCLSSSVIETLYVKENAPKLCQMIYVLLEIAKNERFKTLRMAAITCIMAIARVLDDNDFNDLVTRNQIAEVFLFFLPGVASKLKSVALIDEKFGHKVPSLALKAWGRIVTLLMQDYKASDQKFNFDQTKTNVTKINWKDGAEIEEYIQNTSRSPDWYRETDKKLQQIVVEFAALTHHSHPGVRLELVEMASLIIENCGHTMPTSVSHLIDIVIILSEDDDGSVSERSRSILDELSRKLPSNEFKSLLDNLEESFFSVVTSIPRKFNGIDERVQIVALNSLIGYIELFGKHSLTRVLHSTTHLNRLVLTLVHISEFDVSNVSTLDEYSDDTGISWKKFRYFREFSVLGKIETICRLLGQHGAAPVVTDFLLDIFLTDFERKKEAVFLLNEVMVGLNPTDRSNSTIFRNVVFGYTDGSCWYLPLSVGMDEEGYEHTLGEVQSNIIQTCLLVEGLGKIALSLGKNFQEFMLRLLYLILERAGSAHPLIRATGSLTLSNIATARCTPSITDLINDNIDYFSFHIERKLDRDRDTGGLNVLAVVIQYSTTEVLNATCELVQELVFRTHNNNTVNLNSYLRVFKIFITGLHKWLKIETDDTFKTKQQKREEFEEYQVSNIEPIEDFSDEIMGKTPQEMYEEDMKKTRTQIDEETNPSEEYKKPDPPTYIKLTGEILGRTLHYLPSKNQPRKLLVLEILKEGLPVLKPWEDEPLPIVHQIWSALVDRFKEDDPLIINYSFQLLVVLARLSKEFIRSRTTKEVLPQILHVLEKLAQESYLKDKGSAYRYSQNYKLQVTILDHLARIITDLDMLEHDFEKAMEVVFMYTSDKQPAPLQRSSLLFFQTLARYDPELTKAKIETLTENMSGEYEKNASNLRSYLDK